MNPILEKIQQIREDINKSEHEVIKHAPKFLNRAYSTNSNNQDDGSIGFNNVPWRDRHPWNN